MMRPLWFLVASLGFSLPAFAAWTPDGVDLSRPRLLYRAGDLATIQARAEREPYRQLISALAQRGRAAESVALDDHAIGSERAKARAAKSLAFLYAIDRTFRNGSVVPFETADDRAAVGTRVRELLVDMYTRSRLAVPAPLGGWDRDISTSEELLQYATAYDTMLGAGFDFGADDAVIVGRLTDLAAELYQNYIAPGTAGNAAILHQNNHRSKTGAALAVTGIALAEHTPEPGTDPDGLREPSTWIEYGLDLTDLILRYALVTGDGAYGEGPFYMRYTAQNVLPFARAWDRLVDGKTWNARGLEIPSLWRHPLFLRSQRWLLDMTLPDGSLAPTDDGNPGRAYYFGAAPTDPATAAAFAWRWANAPTAYEIEGNIDLAADTIATYDDSVIPAPPSGSGTAFYIEGGNAIFRSDWSADAIEVVVTGEHDTASEFGRDRNGDGVSPESHEHADPGSFLLHAFGERLALDPGYLDFGARAMVNKPQHHNLILVNGRGPVDYLAASLRWQSNLAGRPAVDGQATLSEALDSDVVDAVRVTSRYGQPVERAAIVTRRFLFADDRYLVIADTLDGPRAPAATFTWLLHGNGGVDSGGTFDLLPNGGRWSRPGARLDATIAIDVGPPVLATDTAVHENPGREQRSHTVLRASATAAHAHAIQVLYPTRANQSPPDATIVPLAHGPAVRLEDTDNDRRLLAWHRRDGDPVAITPPGFSEIATDGQVVLVDTHLDGRARLLWAEAATFLAYGELRLAVETRGILGVRLAEDRAEVVAASGDATVSLSNLPFAAVSGDGICDAPTGGASPVVRLGRERRFVLRTSLDNGAPAADPGSDQRVAVGADVVLDGRASCDPEGDTLSPHWEFVSAPAGSVWRLSDAETWTPRLNADQVGVFRVRLTVTDSHGVASRPAEVVIVAGDRCADGIDDDLDGLIDSDDPDCDAAVTPPEPPCAGDCAGDRLVSVAEVVRCVKVALGDGDLVGCEACDADGNGRVGIDELVLSVHSAVAGCGD